jgi:hypothetical protein
MGHWPKPEPEDYEDLVIYHEQLDLWREHEEELMKDYCYER